MSDASPQEGVACRRCDRFFDDNGALARHIRLDHGSGELVLSSGGSLSTVATGSTVGAASDPVHRGRARGRGRVRGWGRGRGCGRGWVRRPPVVEISDESMPAGVSDTSSFESADLRVNLSHASEDIGVPMLRERH